jgi:uncharacterized protein (TIGR02118 family)
MHKLVLLFRIPSDVVQFERQWSEEFVPKIEGLPGIRRVTVSRILGGPAGEMDLHLIHEVFFDDRDSMMRAMTSEEGQAAGRSLMGFAGDHVTLCFAEHLEEDRRAIAEVQR